MSRPTLRLTPLVMALTTSAFAFAFAGVGLADSKRATREPVFDCESAPDFSKHLSLEPLQTIVDGSASCVGDRDAKSSWLISATIRDDGDQTSHVVFLQLDGQGRVLNLTRGPSVNTEHYLDLKAVADFDGDGLSEIIGEEVVHSPDSVSRSVVVLAARPSGTVRLLARRFDFRVNVSRYTGGEESENHAELTCKSKYIVFEREGRAVLTVAKGVLTREPNVSPTASLSEDHCQSRRTFYGWNGDKIAATNPQRVNADDDESTGSCPPRRFLAKALGLRGGETLGEPIRCLPGRFPRRTLVVAAVVSDGADPEAGEVMISGITEDGRLSFRHRLEEYVDPSGAFETYKLDRVVDLNGDGTDEILVRGEQSNPMSTSDSLLVLGLRGSELRTLLERDLGTTQVATFGGAGEHDYRPVKPEDAMTCKASLAVEPREENNPLLVITRSANVGRNVEEQRLQAFCTPSTESFEVRAGRLRAAR